MTLGIRVLREQDQAILNAMPTQINGRRYPSTRRVEAMYGRSKGAPQLVERAKAFKSPTFAFDGEGHVVQVLIDYPDGETLYRYGDVLVVGTVTDDPPNTIDGLNVEFLGAKPARAGEDY